MDEIESVNSLKRELPWHLSTRIPELKLEEALFFAKNENRALLLFLDNSNCEASNNFIVCTALDDIQELLNSFYIVGWNIENEVYHNALTKALMSFENLAFLCDYIKEKRAAVICVVYSEDNPYVFSCLTNFSYESLKENLLAVTVHLVDNVYGNDGAHQAVNSLRLKLPQNVHLRFFNLEEAIEYLTSSDDEIKPVLLYFHSSNDSFGRMFLQQLMNNSELVQFLNQKFLFSGWDLDNTTYYNALISALIHNSLLQLTVLIRNNTSSLICIAPLTKEVTILSNISNISEIKSKLEEILQNIPQPTGRHQDFDATNFHLMMANRLADRDYDAFEYDEDDSLWEKIAFAIAGPPFSGTSNDESDQLSIPTKMADLPRDAGYDKTTKDKVDKLFKLIVDESKNIAECRGRKEISIIYNCLVPLSKEKAKRSEKYTDYNPNTDFNPVPLFVLRKCRESNTSTLPPCRIVIDDTGRMYADWSEFLNRNKYPPCEMIYPLNGRYSVTNGQVDLGKCFSASCDINTQLAQAGDIASTGIGLTSGAVIAASAVASVTIAPAVMITAVSAGVASGVWAIGRSAYSLYDRKRHNESLSFMTAEARGAYFNIVAGTLGFVGAGAPLLLRTLVANGVAVGKGATYAINTINVLNLTASGASLANSAYDVLNQWLNENQTPSTITIIQLTSSILFFGHAVYNFRNAQTIIDETQAKVLQEYQDSLRSNRHRKTFTRLVRETQNIHDNQTQARAEVISALRKIHNKDEVFAALTRNTRTFTKAGIRFSASDGQISFGNIAVDLNEFCKMNKLQSEAYLMDFRQNQPRPPTTYTSNNTRNIQLETIISNCYTDMKVKMSQISIHNVVKVVQILTRMLSGDVREKLTSIAHTVISKVLHTLTRSVINEIDEFLPRQNQFIDFFQILLSYFYKKTEEIEEKYKKYIRTGDCQYYEPMFDYISPVTGKRLIQIFEFLVNNSYSKLTLCKAVVDKLSEYFTKKLMKYVFDKIEEKRRQDELAAYYRRFNQPKRVNCSICGGYFYENT
ncbi:hypothetical protein ABEB36_002250 [Hypothenemus hampei]|uniref:DUF4781 domain-containing protein n=1 Tax=Hypothenemus hampei TaxID=57062 RepID=A0ABD1F6Q5_HYPHA